MKKYLLVLGCVCVAFALMADDHVVAGVSASGAPAKTSNVNPSSKQFEETPTHKGGKPRQHVDPSKPRIVNNVTDHSKPSLYDSGNVGCMSEETSVSFSTIHTPNWSDLKQHLLDNGSEPMGGKRRKPTDPSKPTGGGFGNLVMGNLGGSVTSPSTNGTNVTIDDVTTLIDQLLEGNQAAGKSIDDVTMLIDQLLINTAE